jgi:hypothetical protein
MYEVEWLDAAVQELAGIWLAAGSNQRARINQATRIVDQTLRHNPYQKGESRSSGRRIFFALPIGVFFRVERHAPVVTVTHVWWIPTRR